MANRVNAITGKVFVSHITTSAEANDFPYADAWARDALTRDVVLLLYNREKMTIRLEVLDEW